MWINLETVELMGESPQGLNAKLFRGFLAAVQECHPKLAGWWETYHGEPVVLS